MKAIQVKFLGPTNTKGSRWKAFVDGGNQVTVSTDYALNSDENALQAATKLLYKMGWNDNSKINGFGSLPNGDYVATLTSK